MVDQIEPISKTQLNVEYREREKDENIPTQEEKQEIKREERAAELRRERLRLLSLPTTELVKLTENRMLEEKPDPSRIQAYNRALEKISK